MMPPDSRPPYMGVAFALLSDGRGATVKLYYPVRN